MKNKATNKFLLEYFALLAFLIFFLLRIPSLFEPLSYGDEGIYLTLGRAARKGLVFYRDIHDNKPPLLYLIAALAGSFRNYRLVYFLWSEFGFFLFYFLAKSVYPKNYRAVLAALFSFAILTAIPFFEGNIANAENFLIYTSIAAFWLLLEKQDSLIAVFVSGLLFSLSALFKIPAVFDFLTALVIFFLLQNKNLKKIVSSFSSLKFWLLIGGFTLPIILSLFYYFLKGAGQQYLTAAFAQNIPYLSSWGGKKQAFSLPIPLLFRGFLVGLIVLFLFKFKKSNLINQSAKLTFTWFSFSIFAALLSSRPYPHYLFQALPAVCLSLGLLFSKNKIFKLTPVVFSLIIAFVFVHFDYFHYPTFPYYRNYINYARGAKTKKDYLSFWGEHVPHLYQTAAYLKSRTKPGEKIFIWGDHPELYPLSDRLPVGRYAAAYHIKDFDQNQQETTNVLKNNPPRFWVVFQQEKNSLNGQLINFLHRNYSVIKNIGAIDIYFKSSLI